MLGYAASHDLYEFSCTLFVVWRRYFQSLGLGLGLETF